MNSSCRAKKLAKISLKVAEERKGLEKHVAVWWAIIFVEEFDKLRSVEEYQALSKIKKRTNTQI